MEKYCDIITIIFFDKQGDGTVAHIVITYIHTYIHERNGRRERGIDGEKIECRERERN